MAEGLERRMDRLLPAGRVPHLEPSVSSWAPNRLDVFARGSDNALYHKSWNGIGVERYERLGGNLEGAPAAISRGPNLIDVFFRGRDNHLYQMSYDGSTWRSLCRPRRRTAFRRRGVLVGLRIGLIFSQGRRQHTGTPIVGREELDRLEDHRYRDQ